MKKSSILLFLFLLLLINGCTDNYTTENEPTPSALNKGPIIPPPPPPPPVFGPLDLSAPNLVAACAFDGTIKAYKVDANTYTPIWSVNTQGPLGVAIGDVDNDSQKELLGLYDYTVGSGKNAVRQMGILIYKTGSTGEPAARYQIPYTGDVNFVTSVFITNIDPEPSAEVIVVMRHTLKILKWDPAANNLKEINSFDNEFRYAFHAVVEDIEDDGDFDIFCEAHPLGTIVLFLNEGGVFTTIRSDKALNTTINKTKVCGDIDKDGLIEIIGGGTNCKLNIWKYDEVNKTIILADVNAPVLPGYTMAVTAGDFDQDGTIELSTAAGANIYVYNYSNGVLIQERQFASKGSITDFMYTGNPDANGYPPMLVSSGNGMAVYSNYNQVYWDYWGSALREICFSPTQKYLTAAAIQP